MGRPVRPIRLDPAHESEWQDLVIALRRCQTKVARRSGCKRHLDTATARYAVSGEALNTISRRAPEVDFERAVGTGLARRKRAGGGDRAGYESDCQEHEGDAGDRQWIGPVMKGDVHLPRASQDSRSIEFAVWRSSSWSDVTGRSRC
jgi:hypothetical protein